MLRLCWMVALLFVALSAQAGDSAANTWLDRLAHSMSELNYRGVMSYERGDHLESLRVTHAVVNGEEFERLEHLDGEHREIVRRGAQLTCIQVGQRLSRLFHKHVLKGSFDGLDPYYTVSVGDEGRIAGRHIINIAIKPRDEYRFGYRLALDYDTGLLLRSESIDAKEKVLERLQFVDIEIGQPFKKEWFANADSEAAKTTDPRTVERVIEEVQMAWQPQWLPPGFVLSLAPRQPSEDVLTYSDGLAVLSVFVAAEKSAQPAAEGHAMQGATVAVTKSAQFGGAPYAVTVVGEVPHITAQKVANSVVWRGAH